MRVRSRIINQIAGAGIAGLTRLWASTLRFRMHFDDPSVDPLSPTGTRKFIISTWHDAMILPIMLRRTIGRRTPQNRMTTLVSQHQDGSFLTYAMHYFYLGSIRGSTRRGGAQALAQMIQDLNTQHVCITPDGPRGPARTMSPGIVSLASLSGKSIIPAIFTCSRAWSIKGSWTDFILPRPFSTVYGVAGPQFHVPPNLERDEIESYRLRLQEEMNRLQAMGDELAAGRSPNRTNQRNPTSPNQPEFVKELSASEAC